MVENKLEEKVDTILARLNNPINKEAEPSAKKSNKHLLIVGIVALVVILAVYKVDEIRQPLEDYFFGGEETALELSDADVELYKFSDLCTNASVNVELWLINLGEQPASDITVFVRVRNQNGTVLLSKEISPTVLVLRYNETCSAVYNVPISIDDTYVLSTIEVEWNTGRVSYSKQTDL